MSVRDFSKANWLIAALYAVMGLYVVNILVRTLSFSDPRARIFPLLFGVPTALLLGILVVRELNPIWFDELLPTRSVTQDEESTDGRLDWLTVFTFASFPFVAYLVGFTIAVPAYTLALTSRTCERLRTALGITLVVTVGWWLVFVQLLNVIFFEGVLL
jgi:hypothetical protein